jgi:hypothetical protein
MQGVMWIDQDTIKDRKMRFWIRSSEIAVNIGIAVVIHRRSLEVQVRLTHQAISRSMER